MKSKKVLISTVLWLAMFVSPALQAVGLSQNFNFDGYLLDAGGTPIAGPVTVKFGIYNPSANCLLYEEGYAAVTPAADGYISLKVGGGSATGIDPGLVFKTIFQNDAVVRAPGANCASGYTPAAGDGRKLRVTVGGVALSPDYSMSSVPMATVAESLQGKVPADFMSVNPYYTFPAADGSANQVMQTDGAGHVTWATPSSSGITSFNGSPNTSQTLAINSSGSTPAWSTAGGTHTLSIPLASSGSVTAGLISNAEYNSFNNKMDYTGATMTGFLNLSADPTSAMHAATKQYVDNGLTNVVDLSSAQTIAGTKTFSGSVNVITPTTNSEAASKLYVDTAVGAVSGGLSSTLNSGQIFVGNGSNVATGMSMNGDATISNTGTLTIAANAVTTAKLANASVSLAKLANGVANGQVMSWNNNTASWQLSNGTAPLNGDVMTWDSTLNSGDGGWKASAAGAAGLSPTLNSSQIFVGNASNVATGVAMSGDATISNTGALNLAASGVTAGTWKSVTVDSKGRVTAGTNPTTLAGYGIVDAIPNAGGSNGQILTSNGANWNPSWNSKLTYSASNAVALNVDATGNIGVGIMSPAVPFHIQNPNASEMVESTTPNMSSKLMLAGNITSNDFPIGQMSFRNTSNSFNLASIEGRTDAAGNNMGALVFATSPAAGSPIEKMRITSNGNVGIGTTTPSVALEVMGQIKAQSITIVGGGNAPGTGCAQAGQIGYFSGGSQHVFCNGTVWQLANNPVPGTTGSPSSGSFSPGIDTVSITSPTSGITLNGMVDGGNYFLVLKSAATTMYTLSGSGCTYKYNPANAATTTADAVYKIHVVGATCYVDWKSYN